MNSPGMHSSRICRSARWLLDLAFLLAGFHVALAGNARELSKKWGHPIEVFSVARQMNAPAGHLILREPSPNSDVLKSVEIPDLVNVKARMIGDTDVYYISDWSWKLYTEKGKKPNWITVVGHGVTTEVERTLRDDSGPLVRLRYLTLKEDAVSMLLGRNSALSTPSTAHSNTSFSESRSPVETPALSAFLGSKGGFTTVENAVFRKLVDIAEFYSCNSSSNSWGYYENVEGDLGMYVMPAKEIMPTAIEFLFYLNDPIRLKKTRIFSNIEHLVSSCQLALKTNNFDGTEPNDSILHDLRQGAVKADQLFVIGHIKADIALHLIPLRSQCKYSSSYRDWEGDKKLAAFYRNIAPSGAPSDFFELRMSYQPCADGWWEVTVKPRPLCLRVLALENISSRPLTITDTVVEEGDQRELGTELDHADLVSKRRQYFAPGKLKPGELLIIPLQLTFPAPLPQPEDIDLPSVLNLEPAAVESALGDYKHVNVIEPGQKNGAHALFRISKHTFLNCYVRNRFRNSGKDYIYGPVVHPIEAQIDGKTYPISEFEYESLLVAQSNETGSCPTIYAVNRWDLRERVGHFLTGQDSAEKEGFYRMRLNDFGGVLEIFEEDAETSYIKWVRLRCVDSNGEAILVYPSHPVLGDPENGYQEFEQGQRLTVAFPDFDPDGAHKTVWLEGYGYYVPHLNVAKQ